MKERKQSVLPDAGYTTSQTCVCRNGRVVVVLI
jgi:hypothetical protein